MSSGAFGNPTQLSNQLPINQVFSNNPQELLIQQTKIYNDQALNNNARDIATYSLIEIQNGQQFFTPGNPQQIRQAYRTTYQLPPLSAPHRITNYVQLTLTRIYGTGFDGNIWYPLPYVDVSNLSSQIQVVINSLTYDVIRGGTAPALLKGILVLEYLKN